jgi:hypothetical protein
LVAFAASRPESEAPALVLPLGVRVVASCARFSRCSAAELLGCICCWGMMSLGLVSSLGKATFAVELPPDFKM